MPEGTRDTELLASGADVAQFLGPAEEIKPKGVYLVFEGHCGISQVLVWR